MLIQLLAQHSTITFKEEVMSWEEAMRLGAEPLVKADVIEGSYVEKMIKNVRDLGPYIVVAPKLALAHARPEDGVKQLGISLLINEKPIRFSNHDVHILFTLAAPDSSSHLSLLADLATVCADDLHLEALLTRKTAEEVLLFLAQCKGVVE